MKRVIKTILYSSHFERAFQRLPIDLRREAAEREAIFRRDCFDPRLKTHKLKGAQRELWSFSITHAHRILFQFLANNTAYFVDAGDHSIYE